MISLLRIFLCACVVSLSLTSAAFAAKPAVPAKDEITRKAEALEGIWAVDAKATADAVAPGSSEEAKKRHAKALEAFTDVTVEIDLRSKTFRMTKKGDVFEDKKITEITNRGETVYFHRDGTPFEGYEIRKDGSAQAVTDTPKENRGRILFVMTRKK